MSAGELGTLGGSFGIWMHLAQGEVSEDKAKPLSKMLRDAFDDGLRAPAVRALVVSVLQKNHIGIFRALDMLCWPFGKDGVLRCSR